MTGYRCISVPGKENLHLGGIASKISRPKRTRYFFIFILYYKLCLASIVDKYGWHHESLRPIKEDEVIFL